MEGRIRVLMCCSDLRSVKGGMVTLVRDYLEYRGWSFTRLLFVATHCEGGKIKKGFFFLGAYLKILFLLLGKQADLIHFHMAERGSFYRGALILKLGRCLKVPVIFHHHGAEFEDFYRSLSAPQRRFAAHVLEQADCNLVLSERLKKQLLKKAPKARVEVLYNAVPIPTVRNQEAERDRILMLGRQGARKGSYDLLKAIAQIGDRLPENIRLWMCGDGETEEIKREADRLGIGGRLAFVGWVDGQQKEECLKKAMMHVLPSYREALPMSILETMSRGIPNISTDIASIPEVIKDGETGLLIRPGEVERLAESILRLATDRTLREQIGEKGRERIRESFSLEACVNRLEKQYRGLLNR